MRGERATMGKSLLDVQREIKIKAAFIAAIEGGDLGAFPTPGFIAGFVKSYARYLGLEPEWAYQKFCEETGFKGVHGVERRIDRPELTRSSDIRFVGSAPSGDDALLSPRAPFAPRDEGILDRLTPAAFGSAALVLALVLGLGYGAWNVLQEIQRVQLAPVDGGVDIVAGLDPVRESAVAKAREDAVVLSETAAALGVTRRDAARLYRPGPQPGLPPIQSRDTPIAMLDPDSTGVYARAAAASSAGGANAATAADEGIATRADRSAADLASTAGQKEQAHLAAAAPEIVVYAARPAWIQITAPDGSVLFEKILDAEETASFVDDGTEKLLRAGNSGAVFLRMGDVLYGPVGQGNRVARDIRLGRDEILDRFEPVRNFASVRPRARPARLSQAESN